MGTTGPFSQTLLTLVASSSGFLIDTRLSDIGRIRFPIVSSGLSSFNTNPHLLIFDLSLSSALGDNRVALRAIFYT